MTIILIILSIIIAYLIIGIFMGGIAYQFGVASLLTEPGTYSYISDHQREETLSNITFGASIFAIFWPVTFPLAVAILLVVNLIYLIQHLIVSFYEICAQFNPFKFLFSRGRQFFTYIDNHIG